MSSEAKYIKMLEVIWDPEMLIKLKFHCPTFNIYILHVSLNDIYTFIDLYQIFKIISNYGFEPLQIYILGVKMSILCLKSSIFYVILIFYVTLLFYVTLATSNCV